MLRRTVAGVFLPTKSSIGPPGVTTTADPPARLEWNERSERGTLSIADADRVLVAVARRAHATAAIARCFLVDASETKTLSN